MDTNAIQIGVFVALTSLVAVLTGWRCRRSDRSADVSRDYVLAGGGMGWPSVAGSLLLAHVLATARG